MSNGAVGTLVGLVVLLAVILVCREIACWYWKINEAIRLLTSIDTRLHWLQTNAQSERKAAAKSTSPTAVVSDG